MIEVEKKPTRNYPHVRCGNKVYTEIVDIANDCDLTITQVVTSLLEYALKHVEVKREQKTVEVCRLMIGVDENGNEDK